MTTLVQIKRSTANAVPDSLSAGELAYSYVSNVIFIGDTATGVMNIGGQYYTDLIDNADAANGASTFVRRYANGSAQFDQLDILTEPTSNTHVATKSYVDGAISANISLDVLTDVIVDGTAGDQNNRILLGHANGNYVTTAVSGNVTISNTGVITIGNEQVTGAMLANTLTGDKTLSGNLTVTGDLYVQGNTTTIETETLVVEDSLIKLANNNSSDAVDIGFYGVYNSTSYAGLFRDASDGVFKLFADYTDGDPTGNTLGAVARATLQANLDALTVNTATANVSNILEVGNLIAGAANVTGVVNLSSDLWVGGNTYVVQSANIVGSLNVQSATWLSSLQLGAALGVADGGTGTTAFTANGVFFADTTSSLSFATGTEGEVLQIASGVPAFAMLDGGSF
jgi:hypothetical protein